MIKTSIDLLTDNYLIVSKLMNMLNNKATGDTPSLIELSLLKINDINNSLIRLPFGVKK